ncbi:MAG: hypothetical protein Q8S58_11325 [Bosea sp. (in: a-proteobacteria)]|uniref:DUF6894 family protein n=1 Tax=Bosea sp. (in: a-proteobacteria) TaxID=1871050 RepID=UPI002736A819|nr:hypothetical protein [Bosea sp. (in: a-proteobacteria)]MDP3256496.1 hypothetical protein [Bosea sp. (in: a-proteobacteria)]MDP3319711.1 hypothetical protein [Bosea sp. (in: a-proteobacteria)]
MPRYFITSDDGSGPEREPEPLEFPDEKTATDDAQLALAEMAVEVLPRARQAALSVSLDDEAGEAVYRASVTIEARRGEEIRAADAAHDAAADTVAELIKGR